jgi:hypothetical protein
MTSACTFHGIIGVQNAAPYALDKKRYWKMDGYVPLPFETHPSAEDLEVTVFAFGGGTPPPEDGIYFINARLITVTNDDETNIEMCCVDLRFFLFSLRTPSLSNNPYRICSYLRRECVLFLQ